MAIEGNIYEIIGQLMAKIDQLSRENSILQAKVKTLTERLTKYETPKNSGNSSKPPSSDFPKPKKTQSLRGKTGKKPGGQPGHEGKTLRMVETPDIVQPLKPQCCAGCGHKFEDHQFVAAGRKQVIDIPPIKPAVTEYQVFEAQCTCGHKTTAQYPAGVQKSVSYGDNILALVSYLSARQYMPVARIAEFFASVFNLKISTGGICYLLEKSKLKLTPQYEGIRQFVLASHIIGADETGANINGKNHWAWVFQNMLATFLSIHKSRGIKAISEIMPEGFANTTLVTDCWPAYFKEPDVDHQLCLAHLMRDLIYLGQLYPKNNWSPRLLGLIQNAMDLHKDDKLTNKKTEEIKRTFTLLIEEPLDIKLKLLLTFQRRMVKYSNYVFHFLTTPNVPPDNNGSERAIRNFKVKLKVSGLFRSIEGANTYATLRSLIDTAIKRGQNPFLMLQTMKLEPVTE